MNIKYSWEHERASFFLAIIRFALGFAFLYSAIDKTFGIRMSAPSEALINGGCPTAGYVQMVSGGPFGFLFEPLTDVPNLVAIVITVAMFLLAISLLLGIGRKLGCYLGAVMMFFFYLSSFPIAENPFIDYRIIFVFVLIAIANSPAYSIMGFGDQWKETPLVKRFPILE